MRWKVQVTVADSELLSVTLRVKEWLLSSVVTELISCTRDVMLKATLVWFRRASPTGIPRLPRIDVTVASLIRSSSVVVIPIAGRAASRASESTVTTNDLIPAGAVTVRLASSSSVISTVANVEFEGHSTLGPSSSSTGVSSLQEFMAKMADAAISMVKNLFIFFNCLN